jgi:hypothetical protein
MRAHCAPVGPGLQSDRAGCHDPGTPQAIEECVARVHATDVTHLAHGRAVDPARSALTQFSRSLPATINRVSHKLLLLLTNLEAQHQLNGVNGLKLDLNDFF